MKPNFSLELSHSGIKLFDLSAGAPVMVGEVDLSDPDFESRISDLRNRAAETSDLPMATEIVIPNSEILYTTLDHPNIPDGTKSAAKVALREEAVREELEGMTPYPLADLCYIWRLKSQNELSVAAVARETLAEAEAFAAAKGFNPVRFHASPERSKFGGPVNFGPTHLRLARQEAERQAARDALEKAERRAALEAEKAPEPAPAPAPVVKTGPADPPADTPAPADQTSGETVTPVRESSTDKAKDPVVSATGTAEPAKEEPQEAPAPENIAPPAARPRMSLAAAASAPKDAGPDTGTAPDAGTRDAPATDGQRGAPVTGTPAKDPVPTGTLQKGTPKRAPLAPLSSALDLDDVPAAPVAFASRRKPIQPDGSAALDISLSEGAVGVDGKESRLSRLAARFGAGPNGPPSVPGADVPPPPPRRAPLSDGAGKVNPSALARASGPVKPLRGSAGTVAKPPVARRPLNGGAPRVTPTGTLPAADRAAEGLKAAPTLPPAHVTRGAMNEADAMTVFGARTPPKGGGRALLPVMIGLIVAVVLTIAVWTAFFVLDTNEIVGEGQAPQQDLAMQTDPVPSLVQDPTSTAPPAEDPTSPATSAADPTSPDTSVEEAALTTLPAETPAPTAPTAEDTAEPVFTLPEAPGTEIAALPESPAQDIDGPSAGRTPEPDSPVDTSNPRAPSVPPAAEVVPDTETEAPAPLPERPSPDPLQRAMADDSVDGDAVVSRYATTGVWERAPEAPEAPTSDRVDDLYVAALDGTIAPQEVARLPDVAAPERPDAPLPPAPPGSTFDLDDRGLVAATPDGALSPQGIMITAGPPPRAPPSRPARPASLAPTPETQPDLPRTRPRDRPAGLAPDQEQTRLAPAAAGEPLETALATPDRPAEEPDTDSETAGDAEPATVSQRAAVIPRDRPADLTPESSGEPVEAALATTDQPAGDPGPDSAIAENPAPVSQRASVKPRARPDALSDLAPSATEGAQAAADAALAASTLAPVQVTRAAAPPRRAPSDLAVPAAVPPAAIEEAVAVALTPAEPVSPYAVAQSRVPRERPARLAAAAAKRLAAAPPPPQQQQTRQPTVTRIASPAAVTTPRIPSKASVAQRATIKNAINLGKINLIGVYGSTSNRRALIRLASGKFVKVKVGDRVDGGRVAAIGQSELSYTKSGRRVILSMPKG